MQQESRTPLLKLEFGVGRDVFAACSRMMGQRLKNRNMPRMTALGVIFIAAATGALCYLLFYLHQTDWKVILMGVALLLLGVYNLVYFPLLFEPLLDRRTQRLFDRSQYLGKQVVLSFWEDYIEETAADGRNNRVRWGSIQAVERGESFYMLRLTADSGIIIPRDALADGGQETLEALLERKLVHRNIR